MTSRFARFSGDAQRLFDLPTEHVIAYARLALAAVALAAIYLDPSQPSRDAEAAFLVLIAYLSFASLAVIAALLGLKVTTWSLATHFVDIAAGAILMHLTEGPTSPYFLFFTFALLSATLRWDWRGALLTAALQFGLLAAVILMDPHSLGTEDDNLNRVIMRGAHLFVLGLLLGFVGAYRARSGARFAKLAAWPASEYSATDEPPLEPALAHAANTTGAETMLVTWIQDSEPHLRLCWWDRGRFTHEYEPTTDGFPMLIADSLNATTFMTTGGQVSTVRTPSGLMAVEGPAISPQLESRHPFRRVVTAPFTRGAFRGRVFAIECRRLGDDLMPLIEIIAYRLGAEIEYHFLHRQNEAAAKARERIRIAREVHDGALQSLTAAALHLKVAEMRADDELKGQLEMVGRIITEEQRQIRALVDLVRPKAGSRAPFRLARDGARILDGIGHRWRCETRITVTPPDATVPPELGEQLYFVLAESVANAARHGDARRVSVDIRHDVNALVLGISDDGRGFAGLSGSYDLEDLVRKGIGPVSLCERVKMLGGEMCLSTGARGAALHIRIPCDQA